MYVPIRYFIIKDWEEAVKLTHLCEGFFFRSNFSFF